MFWFVWLITFFLLLIRSWMPWILFFNFLSSWSWMWKSFSNLIRFFFKLIIVTWVRLIFFWRFSLFSFKLSDLNSSPRLSWISLTKIVSSCLILFLSFISWLISWRISFFFSLIFDGSKIFCWRFFLFFSNSETLVFSNSLSFSIVFKNLFISSFLLFIPLSSLLYLLISVLIWKFFLLRLSFFWSSCVSIFFFKFNSFWNLESSLINFWVSSEILSLKVCVWSISCILFLHCVYTIIDW